jgi:hypothetical protein
MHDAATMTREQAAAYVGLRPSTLAKFAAEDRGPPFVKLAPHARSGRIFYLREELDSWLRAGAPTDRRGARPSSYPTDGYSPRDADARRNPDGRFAPRDRSP